MSQSVYPAVGLKNLISAASIFLLSDRFRDQFSLPYIRTGTVISLKNPPYVINEWAPELKEVVTPPPRCEVRPRTSSTCTSQNYVLRGWRSLTWLLAYFSCKVIPYVIASRIQCLCNNWNPEVHNNSYPIHTYFFLISSHLHSDLPRGIFPVDLTNYIAYETSRFSAAFTRALQ